MNLTVTELQSVNKCRFYLQCVTAADIYLCDGSTISKRIRESKNDKTRRSRYKWPFQAEPTRKDWKAWKKAIDLVWDKNGHRLGHWYRDKYHGLFHWWFSASTEKAYRKLGNPGRWFDYFKTIHTRTSQDRRRYRYMGPVDHGPPDDLVPTSVLDSSQNDI